MRRNFEPNMVFRFHKLNSICVENSNEKSKQI